MLWRDEPVYSSLTLKCLLSSIRNYSAPTSAELPVPGVQLDGVGACAVDIIMSSGPKYILSAAGVSSAHHLAGVNPHSRHNMCQLSCWLSLGFKLNWWLKSSQDIKNRTICIARSAGSWGRGLGPVSMIFSRQNTTQSCILCDGVTAGSSAINIPLHYHPTSPPPTPHSPPAAS